MSPGPTLDEYCSAISAALRDENLSAAVALIERMAVRYPNDAEKLVAGIHDIAALRMSSGVQE